jgi:hypothetical protein
MSFEQLKQELANEYPRRSDFRLKGPILLGSSSRQKWQSSILLTVLFLILSLPFLYKFSDKLFGSFFGQMSDENGSPSSLGLIVHGFIFLLIVRLLLR